MTDEDLRERLVQAVNGNPISADDAWAIIHHWDRRQEWYGKTWPLIGALAIYGEESNLAALVAKARELVKPVEEEQHG